MPLNLRPAPPEILAIVGELIAAHFPELTTARIAVLVRDAALEEEGDTSDVAAAAVVDDPALPFEFVTWFAWDVWQTLSATEREALVFHELMHFGHDADGKPWLRPHDAGVFSREVELYGAWWERAQAAFKAREDAREGKGGM